MDNRKFLIDQLRQLSDQWYENHKNGIDNTKITEEYNKNLNELYDTGWNYSLYLVNEIPVEFLPEFYVLKVKQLLNACNDLLGSYKDDFLRSKLSEESKKIVIQKYQLVFTEVCKMGHDDDELFMDVEVWLSDVYMPKFYLNDFMRNVINIYDREHQINKPDSRKVRTIGLSQITGDEPEEWY